jgi:hypothetical protein
MGPGTGSNARTSNLNAACTTVNNFNLSTVLRFVRVVRGKQFLNSLTTDEHRLTRIQAGIGDQQKITKALIDRNR